MQKIFETGMGGVFCWEIWSSLFTSLPYGGPYIAMLAGSVCFFGASRIINSP